MPPEPEGYTRGVGSPEPATYLVSSQLFRRLVGLCYLAAFVSLWVQVDGLIGSSGVLPVQQFLEAVRRQTGATPVALLPTLCWLGAGDGALHLWCGMGVLAAAAVVADVAPALGLGLCWVLYLSLSVAGQVFLEFQWDSLLLETGLIALWLAPLSAWPRRSPAAPPALARWLWRWLLFRFMFSSGVVKLASGDPTWRNLTALRYHYETQPLPTWTAWWLHQSPPSFQTISCLVMFAVELLVPFFVFGPRRLRLVAFWAFTGLQASIVASGNYAFFNLLAFALALPLLPDAAFPERLRRLLSPAGAAPASPRLVWPNAVLVPVAALTFFVSGVLMANLLLSPSGWPGPVVSLVRAVSPFRSVNGYGLFAVMTTERPEIVVEGSDDGEVWKAYEFRWKPGDLGHRPRFVAPHQPRLDWQMWFAALGSYDQNPWFVALCARLLQGSRPVTALLAKNPFPDKPPRYLRAVLYDYHFTNRSERRATGDWWRRQERGPYLPVISKDMLREER
jgi:hypothetical protein